MLLDTYAPLKRVKKCKLIFKSKSWITVEKCKLIFKSKPWITKIRLTKINICENNLLTNFINKKDPILKEKCHT